MIGRPAVDRAALAVGRQLAHPEGRAGRLLGAVMQIANRRPTRALLDALDVRPHHRLLDVGCGDGAALALARGCAIRCGVDRSRTMVEAAQRRLGPQIVAGRASIRLGDMEDLPFDAASFDRIMASNILYFCADIPRFVAECRRVARPGARLGIYLTDRETMRGWRFAGPATHRHFSSDDLADELRSAGIADTDRTIAPLRLPGGRRGLVAIVRL